MADPKSRARVERLLRGDFRPDDLTNLFLYARDHCDGREPVADIGHFVAHHNERDRGIVTRSTRDWFAVARFHLPSLVPNGAPLISAKAMPPATKDYFRIAVNRIDAQIIRTKTGMRRADAYRMMTDLAARLAQNSDGTWRLPNDLTRTEVRLIKCVASHLVTKPAFEAARLCEDFRATLKSNGLITREELSQHEADIDLLVQLYAVAAMHNCVVQVGDGTTTQLKAAILLPTQILVEATVTDAPRNPEHGLATAIFAANLDPMLHCHPDLLANQTWNFEIELTQDKRLSPLR
ncbi:hypothetical protein [Bradyrhizobium sp. AZCC 1708]|uniref:hypothetical protein n=1 Tax=Bradyrhizobium sp. AZCC 1708 TaxID=3117015 RepID=UPI002FEF7A63